MYAIVLLASLQAATASKCGIGIPCPTRHFCDFRDVTEGACQSCAGGVKTLHTQCNSITRPAGQAACRLVCGDKEASSGQPSAIMNTQATLTNQGACGEGLSPCGTGEFCNFDKGDDGQCQFCDTVSDGCQSQSIRGKEACQLRCNKMPPSKGEGSLTPCRAGLAPCGDGEFCNFNAKDEGICQRCNSGDCSSFVVTSTKGREACEIRCSAKTTQGTTRRRRRRHKKKLDTSTVLSTKDLIKGSLSSKGGQCGGSHQVDSDFTFKDVGYIC
jgi:hypothetical protein